MGRQSKTFLLFNFNVQNIREIVFLAKERSIKRQLEHSRFKADMKVLSTNWISKINPNSTLNEKSEH